MANKLLDRHTRLAKQIEILEAAIAAASKGIDAKEQKFNFQQWKDKWNRSKSKELRKVLNENRIGKGEAVGGGAVKSILSIGERWRDPKRLLKLLKEKETFLAKNLGQKYARNVDDIDGITGGGPLRSKLLMRDRANPFYVRKFDKEIYWKEKELTIQAQNKFKTENKGTWHENYDDPYKGWRQYLDINHSEHPKSPNKSPINSALKSNKDNVTNDTVVTTNQSSSLGIGSRWEGNTLYGGGGLVGRNTDVRRSDGGSTALSIHRGPERYGDLKIGDQIGVRSKSWRKKYDAAMRVAGVEGY